MEINMMAFRTALQLAGIPATEGTVYLVGRIYEEIKAKGDAITLKDIENIKREVKLTMQQGQ